jgi:hypothetical protein
MVNKKDKKCDDTACQGPSARPRAGLASGTSAQESGLTMKYYADEFDRRYKACKEQQTNLGDPDKAIERALKAALHQMEQDYLAGRLAGPQPLKGD